MPIEKDSVTAKLEAIEAITREESFSPEVKQALIEAYIEENLSVEEAKSKTVGFVVGTNLERDSSSSDDSTEASTKRKAVARIYQDTSLSPTEKHNQVQTLLNKPNAKPKDDKAIGGQGRAVQAIYKDTTLSPQEKLDRVEALMKERDCESGLKPRSSAFFRRPARPLLDYVRTARNDEISEPNDSISQLDDHESFFKDEHSRGTGPTRSTKTSTRASKSRTSNRIRRSNPKVKPVKRRVSKEIDVDSDSFSETSEEGNSKRKLYLCIGLSVLFWVIAGPLLGAYWGDFGGSSDERENIPNDKDRPDETSAPASIPTFSPTMIPTYDPPTTVQCIRIGEGNGVFGQNNMPTKTFTLDIDLTLTLGASDISPMVKTLQKAMQETLAPALAGCNNDDTSASQQRMRGNGERKLTRGFVVANAIIAAKYRDNESCSPASSGACFRVQADMTLYLKGYESNLQLINHIVSVFGKTDLVNELRLSDPFEDIEVVNVAASALTTDTPTKSPTLLPTEFPTLRPTPSPTPPPTPNPTLPPIPSPTTPPPVPMPTPWPTLTITNRPSASPTYTQAPTLGRRTHINQALRNVAAYGTNEYDWIVNRDFWIPADWNPPHGEGIWVDRYSLMALFLQMGERRWSYRNGWGDSVDHCNWFGVSCDTTRRVVAIQLSDNRLEGYIPAELSLIEYLETLDLGFNRIRGGMPAHFGLMSNIRTLNLQGSGLSGYFPSWMGNMVSLERLYLSNNELIGTIPTEVGLLSNLETLALGKLTAVSHLLHNCFDLLKLVILFSAGNQMTGYLPFSLKKLSNMEELDLCKLGLLWNPQSTNNMLEGSIPGRLFFMTNLQWLLLHNNELEYNIPNEIFRLTSLRTLRMDRNDLTGDIPPLPATLVQCILEGNSFDDESMGELRGCEL
eukprot:scaffold15643_cov104-Cylindrotheca_fusiformis.AAC.2